MSRPKLSIITICRNAASTIKATLESVARQEGVSPGDFEHWVIDGGSKDQTLEIVKSFPHAMWISEPDQGISDAFNKGVDRSSGDWIQFLNSDDALADSHVLHDLISALDPAFDVIYGRLEIMDETLTKVIRITGDKEGPSHLDKRMTIAHPAMAMHRRYFQEFGKFDLGYKIAMDYELLLRNPHSKFKFLPRTITKFRSGGVSTAQVGLKQARECLRAKTKNRVGSPLARFTWFFYQATRFFLDQNLPNVPVIGKLYTSAITFIQKNY